MESNNNDFGKSLRNLGLFIGLPLLVVVVIWLFMSGDTKKSDKVYSDYLAYFYNDQVKSFDLDLGTSNLTITLKEELRRTATRITSSTRRTISSNIASPTSPCSWRM